MKDKTLWSNPKGIDLSTPFLHKIIITTHDSKQYRSVGQTMQGVKRLDDYAENMRLIEAGLPPRNGNKYRAVHLALYRAQNNNWTIEFYPFKNCPAKNLNSLKTHYIHKFKCNLDRRFNNKARGWSLDDLPEHGGTLTLDVLVPDEITSPLAICECTETRHE